LEIAMNSFTLTAIGNLAKDPEMSAKGDRLYTRFRLVANDYGGRDEQGAPREVVTGVQFVAFGAVAEAIAINARRGDQLIVVARMRADDWVDSNGEKQYRYAFIVDGFRFGAPGRAKREEFVARPSGGSPAKDAELEATASDPVDALV